MRRLVILSVVLGCGGVTKSDRAFCRDEGRSIAAAEGCRFLASACMEAEGEWDVECELQLDCAGQKVTRQHFCKALR